MAFKNAVERFGRVDVVVNNAGYTVMGDTEASTAREGRDLFDTNCELLTYFPLAINTAQILSSVASREKFVIPEKTDRLTNI